MSASNDPSDPRALASGRPERRPWKAALAIYGIVTAICLVTAGASRTARHTDYDHYALLADAWIHGRLDLGGPPPAYTHNNDFAVFDGKYFVSFPPLPAVLIAPAVWIAGGAEKTRDGFFFGLFAGVAPAFIYLALDKLSKAGRAATSEKQNLALALLFAFGTVYWFSAVQGTVWFAAHVIGTGLLAIYLWAAIGADRPALAGLALALAFATRPSLGFAFPFFVAEALGAERRGARPSWLRVLLFGAPGAFVLALLCWHNAARFGDPFEFGHKLLAVAWRTRMEKWGLFSSHYLGRNLAVCLTELPFFGGKGAAFQINGHGLALWITSPFYVWAVWPRRTGATFWALAASAALVAMTSLTYQNSGWLQFGYRFSNDFAPFLIAMIAVGARPLGATFWLLGAFAVGVNGFGAVTFQRAGFERFYFVDGTQRVLHEPD